MNALQTLFNVSYLTDTLLLVPTGNLSELHFQEIEHEGDEILELLDNGDARHVVVDFGNTEYCGSSALSFFIRIWKHVRARNGRMAVCHLSENEREILKVTKLGTLWPVFGSRQEALDSVREIT